MGVGESKPNFPTNDQWQTYRTERLNVVESVRKEIETLQQSTSEQQNEAEKKLLLNMVDYMRECQDRAAIKRVFTDSPACTQAKKELMTGFLDIVGKMDQTSKLQTMKDKIQ